MIETSQFYKVFLKIVFFLKSIFKTLTIDLVGTPTVDLDPDLLYKTDIKKIN